MIVSPEELKKTREMLCEVASLVGQLPDDRAPIWTGWLQTIIDRIDVCRPLGPDGRHGNLHTALCGCEDKP